MKKQRLDKFIASQIGVSRSEARNAIKSGKVSINGFVCRDFSEAADPDCDTVELCGQAIKYKKFVYLMLNKPMGVLSASNDKSRKTVIDLVPEQYRHRNLFPVGRLDRDTTGLLIITDDGMFAHNLISPSKHIPKVYFAELDGPLPPDAESVFEKGVVLADGTECRPAKLEPLPGNCARLTLTEGKYHEVKRMFGTVGLGVNALHRESIGNLRLPPDLPLGKCVELSQNNLILAQNM